MEIVRMFGRGVEYGTISFHSGLISFRLDGLLGDLALTSAVRLLI